MILDVKIGPATVSKYPLVDGNLLTFNLSKAELPLVEKSDLAINGVNVDRAEFTALHAITSRCISGQP
jgi:hypothetical protein